jgi:hypothetical protein
VALTTVPCDAQASQLAKKAAEEKEDFWKELDKRRNVDELPNPLAPRAAYYPETPLPGPPAYVEPISEWVNHLVRDHGFDAAYVNALNAEQRLALHTDAHNNCVREQFVVRRSVKPVAQTFGPASKGINYMKESDAWKAEGWMLIHFTDAPNCPPCVRLEHEILTDPRVEKATRSFKCVLMCWCDPELHPRIKAYGIRKFPTVMLLGPDRKTTRVLEGCPKTADDFLIFLLQANNYGGPPYLPGNAAAQKRLIPTLASAVAPRTRKVVEKPQSSVVVRRSYATGRTPAVHGLGRRAWQPLGQRR